MAGADANSQAATNAQMDIGNIELQCSDGTLRVGSTEQNSIELVQSELMRCCRHGGMCFS